MTYLLLQLRHVDASRQFFVLLHLLTEELLAREQHFGLHSLLHQVQPVTVYHPLAEVDLAFVLNLNAAAVGHYWRSPWTCASSQCACPTS